MKNDLRINEPRLGWFEDGLPNEVTPPTATMLVDDGEQIILHVPWSSSRSGKFGQIERWFSSGTVYGDDPNKTKYSYSPPSEILFHDPFGSISLIGCKAVGYNSNIMWGLGKGRISADAVILGARRFGYNKINGMRTEIKGISRWLDVSSVQKNYRRGSSGALESVHIIGSKLDHIKLHRQLNLKIVPSWESGNDGPGSFYVKNKVFVETRVKQSVDWEKHLELHGAFRDLVRISSWEPVGYEEIKVLRDADAKEVPGHRERIDKWCDLKSHLIVGFNGRSADNQRPWFTYQDIKSSGFARWVKIQSGYARGINPIMATLESSDWPIETKFVNAMIGLEAIAFYSALEVGISTKVAANESIAARLKRVSSDIYLNFLPDAWEKDCADSYNGIKHANRQFPEFEPIIINYYRSILLFRVWICERLGIPKDSLKGRVEFDSMMMYLKEQGAVQPPEIW